MSQASRVLKPHGSVQVVKYSEQVPEKAFHTVSVKRKSQSRAGDGEQAGGRRAGQLGDAMGRGLVRAHVVRVLRRADVLQARTLAANLVLVQKDV